MSGTKIKEVLIRRAEKEAVPTDIIAKIVRDFGKSWGAAYVEDGVLMTACESSEFDAEFFEKLQTDLLDNNFVFFASSEKSEQPFTLASQIEVEKNEETGKDENVEVPLITMFMEGNFKVRLRDQTEHTQHPTVAAYVTKKVKGWMAMHEDDVEKVMEEIRENEFDLLNLIVDRGTFIIVADNGDVFTCSKNATAMKFPWGWMSDSLGFQAQAAKVLDVVKDRVRSAFGNKKHKPIASVEPVQQPAPAPAPAPAEKPEAKPGDQPHKIPDNSGSPAMWWKPSPKMSRSERKSKYKSLNVSLTGFPGWKEGAPTLVDNATYQKIDRAGFGGIWLTQEAMEQELRAKFPGAHAAPPKNVDTSGSSATAEDQDDDENDEDVNTEEANDKQVTAEILPILSPKAQKAIVEGEVLKHLDNHSVEVPDPATLNTLERKYPGLMKQINRPIDAWMKWTYEGLRDFNAAHPDALPILLCDAKLSLWQQQAKINALELKISKLMTSVPKAPADKAPAEAHAPAAAEAHTTSKFKNKFKNKKVA